MTKEEKTVTDGWTWFADYALGVADWTVCCPADRVCQVGMGWKIGGGPAGEKIRFSGMKSFSTWGAGSIVVRVRDGKGDCRVQLADGDYTLPGKTWPFNPL